MSIFFGLQKTSLLDYPGKISAVVFSYGCNFRCPFCHNPELVTEKPSEFLKSETEILDFLKSRVGLLDAVVITGGEPLIHTDILRFSQKIKQLGFMLKVDTNGMFPEKIEMLVKSGIVDYWAMDIKAEEGKYFDVAGIKVTNFAEKNFSKVLKSISLIMQSGAEYEFRTTFIPGLHDSKSAEGIGNLINGATKFYIQNFRNGKTLDPSYRSSGSFSFEDMLKFKQILSRYVISVNIRE